MSPGWFLYLKSSWRGLTIACTVQDIRIVRSALSKRMLLRLQSAGVPVDSHDQHQTLASLTAREAGAGQQAMQELHAEFKLGKDVPDLSDIYN